MTHRSEPTVAVLLAAGGGSRFGGPVHKLDAVLDTDDGRALFDRALDTVVEADIGPVVVVTGARAVAHVPDGVVVVHNPDWARGQASSLRLGLATATGLGAIAAVVGLADQPFVRASAWRAVAASDAPIGVATYDGVRGHPVRLHRDVWDLLPTRGDEGARAVMRVHPDFVEPVPCAGSPADIDTMEDLQRWQSKSSTNSP
jgi:molybdenum cofactor cytidylyltransferase